MSKCVTVCGAGVWNSAYEFEEDMINPVPRRILDIVFLMIHRERLMMNELGKFQVNISLGRREGCVWGTSRGAGLSPELFAAEKSHLEPTLYGATCCSCSRAICYKDARLKQSIS